MKDMDDHDRAWMPLGFKLLIQCLIVYSVATTMLETVPSFSNYKTYFRISEIVVVAIFTIEYLMSWTLSREKLRFPWRPMALVDLLAILPFYLSLGMDLRGLRAIRLMRVFRILKIGRYSRALKTLGEALRRIGPELAMVGFAAVIVIIVSSMCLYYAEHEAQPDVFVSIPHTFWWSIVTLTTVGYGDVRPVTILGKLIASGVMLSGIGLIAVPTGLISSTMTEMIREERATAKRD